METLLFTVRNQHIQRTDRFYPVKKSKNYLYASFDFKTSDWDGKIKSAIFAGSGIEPIIVILEDDKCLVPWEVLECDSFTVSVFAGDLITADTAYIKMWDTGYEEGKTPEEPTPTVYQQLMEKVEEVKEVCETAISESAASAEAAAESEKNANERANAAAISEQNAKQSENNAEKSENNAKEAEDNAVEGARKASESAIAAAESEKNANERANAAAISEANAKESEENARLLAKAAAESEANAKESESNSSASAKEASDSADSAKEYEAGAKESAESARESAESASSEADRAWQAAAITVPYFYIDFDTGCLMSRTEAKGMEFKIVDGDLYGKVVA
jgi:hypothetical protein